MDRDLRVRDVTRHGSWDEVTTSLKAWRSEFETAAAWIIGNHSRDEFRATVDNFIAQAIQQLSLGLAEAQGSLQVLGLATRNLFELDLRVRHVFKSDSNLRIWYSEGIVDSLQVLEGVLSLTADETHPSVPLLQQEQARVRDIATRHGLDTTVRPMGVKELAKAVGAESQYKAFFKLYSKLVHPTAYIVNGTSKAWDLTLRRVLLLQLQICAAETLHAVRSRFSFPGRTDQQAVFWVPADG